MACKSCNSSKKTTTSSNKQVRSSSTNKSSSTANCIGADCYESRYKRPSQFIGRRRDYNDDKCCDDINLDNVFVDYKWDEYICEDVEVILPPDIPDPIEPDPDPELPDFCQYTGGFDFTCSRAETAIPPAGPKTCNRFDFPFPKNVGVTQGGIDFYSTDGTTPGGGTAYLFYYNGSTGTKVDIGTYTIPSGNVLLWFNFNPNLATGFSGVSYEAGYVRMFYYPNSAQSHDVAGGGGIQNACKPSSELIQQFRDRGHTIVNVT